MDRTVKKYHGVIPPFITPVDSRERLDAEGYSALIKYGIERGIHGVFACGTTGETMALTQSERTRTIMTAVEAAAGRVPVFAGVMDTSTARVIDNIKAIADCGVDAAVITPVFYDRHTSQDEIIRHFERIDRETDIDLIVYNIPKFVGERIAPETVIRLSGIGSVKGYKDSGGSFQEFMTVLSEKRDDMDFSCLVGTPVMAPACIMLGADGYVPGTSPLFPEIYVDAYNAAVNKDIALSKEYTDLILEISSIGRMAKNPTAATKFAISTLGFTDKRVICPQDTITPDEEKRITDSIEKIKRKYAEIRAL